MTELLKNEMKKGRKHKVVAALENNNKKQH